MKTRLWVAGLFASSAVVAALGFACSSSSSNGASCTCATQVCTTGTSCASGSACVTDTVPATGSVTQCRALCPDGKTGCALDEHCGTDDVCHAGATPPGVEFDTTAPRPCQAFLQCPFKVKTFGGSGQIDHFDWIFDDDGGVTTTDPTTTHKYAPGSHVTVVNAFDKNGTKASAETSDDVCVDGMELQCSAGVVECCQGACTPEGGCM